MRNLKLVVASVVALTSLTVGPMVQTASAATANCVAHNVLPVSGLSDADRNITVSGNTASAKVTITGDKGCTTNVTLAAWKLPNAAGQPITAQKLYTSTTAKLGVGTHTISVKLPNCFWQVDLLGSSRPTAANGSANYDWAKDRLMGFKYGGTQSCEQTTISTPPSTPDTPVVTAEQPTTQVTALPDTGAASIIAGTVGFSSVVGLAYNLFRQRKHV